MRKKLVVPMNEFGSLPSPKAKAYPTRKNDSPPEICTKVFFHRDVGTQIFLLNCAPGGDRMSGRGAFFFRIVQALLDESDEIRHLTTFYLQQRLLKRKPKIIYQHFIESLFHYNEYEVRQTN